jgi:RIO-like serine/threonine protein kinase
MPTTTEEVERATVRLLGKEGSLHARVRLIEVGERRYVAKDYRRTNPLWRWTVGVWSLRRERRALERLGGIDGVPALEARIGRWIIVMTYYRGQDVGRAPLEVQDRSFFDLLLEIVREMHARGVVHLDLRQRRNVIVRPDGRPAIIDFGASLVLSPTGRLIRTLTRVDVSGVLKYKQRARPESLTDAEADMLAREERRRRYWPFS